MTDNEDRGCVKVIWKGGQNWEIEITIGRLGFKLGDWNHNRKIGVKIGRLGSKLEDWGQNLKTGVKIRKLGSKLEDFVFKNGKLV